MRYSFFLIFFFSLQSQAGLYNAQQGPHTQTFTEKGEIILQNLWKEVGIDRELPQNKPSQDKIILDQNDSKKPLDPIVKPVRKKPDMAPIEKKPSKGESYVQKMLRKNREAIKQKHQAQKDQEQSDRDNKLDQNNLTNQQRIEQARRQAQNKMNQTRKQWQDKAQAIREEFARKKQAYLKNIPQYKNATFELESAAGPKLSAKELKKPISDIPKGDFTIIKGALDLPIRDQGRRPTCAAFAGLRAIELILSNKNPQIDLSEQWFYWASKPTCQRSPCRKRGSWVRNGLDLSKNNASLSIPSEKSCPYNPSADRTNETQIPLKKSCHSRGISATRSYRNLNNLDQVTEAISNGEPVIAGFKLTPNFYRNDGLITQKDAYLGGKMDSHAAGHAVVIVGWMKLPRKFSSEGSLCYLVANSWSEGWGLGGHACITEKWIHNNRIANPFVSVSKVEYENS